jgi:G3E family GTPase
LLWFSESANKHVFQLSGKRYTLDVEPWNASPHANQLMFIGRNLDSEQIRQNLADCQSLSPAAMLGQQGEKVNHLL